MSPESRPFPDEPDLTPRQVGELSGVSYWTVLAEIKRGELRAYRRPGGRLAVRRDDFCAWAYGQPVIPMKRGRDVDAGARGSRGRVERGSVEALDALERRRGAA